jgi:hypothetical protein
MFLVRHSVADASLAARLDQQELRSEELTVVRTRCEGGIFDEALQPTAPGRRPGRHLALLVLEGRALVRERSAKGWNELEIGAGETYVAHEWSNVTFRSLTRTADYLRVFWRAGSVMSDRLESSGRIGPDEATRRASRRLADALAPFDRHAADAAVVETLQALRSSGVPFAAEGCDPRFHEVPPMVHAMARTLDHVLATATDLPTGIELASGLGVGEAQALRRATELFR